MILTSFVTYILSDVILIPHMIKAKKAFSPNKIIFYPRFSLIKVAKVVFFQNNHHLNNLDTISIN